MKQITYQHNTIKARLERQYAASKYIHFLFEGKRILNIDESVLRRTEHRKKSWMPRKLSNLQTNNQRLLNFNLIAAVSNRNEFFFQANRGMTNSKTFSLFLLRLVKELTIREPNWREHTVIMLDNASYHRSAFVKRKLADLGVPTLYLGPYHFKMAPVEMFFSHIKARNLNFM